MTTLIPSDLLNRAVSAATEVMDHLDGEILPPGKWVNESLCKDYPEFPASLCEICPVRNECLLWGIVADEPDIWGGETRKTRRVLRLALQGCDLLPDLPKNVSVQTDQYLPKDLEQRNRDLGLPLPTYVTFSVW